jgi:hypothetical protein
MLWSFGPYFMSKNGTGSRTLATAPMIDKEGPIPRALTIGFAVSGSPAARALRRIVTDAVALAAYIR